MYTKGGVYSYFKKGCRKKCAHDNPARKVIPTFLVAFLYTSMAFRAIVPNFFEEQQ